MSQRIVDFLERPIVRNGIIAVILFNAVLLGLETSASIMADWGPLIRALDMTCLAIFVVEIALKLVAYRLSFFRNGWNIFDFVIVGSSLLPGAQTLQRPAGAANSQAAAGDLGRAATAPCG